MNLINKKLDIKGMLTGRYQQKRLIFNQFGFMLQQMNEHKIQFLHMIFHQVSVKLFIKNPQQMTQIVFKKFF
jgi:hypothetical protein